MDKPVDINTYQRTVIARKRDMCEKKKNFVLNFVWIVWFFLGTYVRNSSMSDISAEVITYPGRWQERIYSSVYKSVV